MKETLYVTYEARYKQNCKDRLLIYCNVISFSNITILILETRKYSDQNEPKKFTSNAAQSVLRISLQIIVTDD